VHHSVVVLAAHPDVAKFEFEDGVVRDAVATLLADESTIERVLVDLATERALALSDATEPAQWDGSILVSATDSKDVDLGSIGELVGSVASVVSTWSALVTEVSDLGSTWVGSPTPGPKVSFVLGRGQGVDSESFHSSLVDVLSEAADKMPEIGCRAITSAPNSNSTSAVASLWFPTEESLNDAVASQLFSPIMTSHLFDAAGARTLTTIEHRLSPNPNAWSMPTEPLMPVRESADDSSESS